MLNRSQRINVAFTSKVMMLKSICVSLINIVNWESDNLGIAATFLHFDIYMLYERLQTRPTSSAANTARLSKRGIIRS